MKASHVKRTCTRPFFVNFKKHYCPVCNEKLKKVKISRIVNSRSEEAKDFDFSSSGDGYMTGNVKFVWTEFACSDCTRNFSVNEIYDYEKTGVLPR
ncbi:MAG: hypothetical protein IJF41_05170 [Clostridia bacterium]|nr:hypothetical protein [Clostridia bacterium]